MQTANSGSVHLVQLCLKWKRLSSSDIIEGTPAWIACDLLLLPDAVQNNIMDDKIWVVRSCQLLQKKKQFPEETNFPSYQISLNKCRSNLPLLGDLKALVKQPKTWSCMLISVVICNKATRLPLRTRAVIGLTHSQREHHTSHWICQHCKSTAVGSVSEAAWRMNENWPGWHPSRSLFQEPKQLSF